MVIDPQAWQQLHQHLAALELHDPRVYGRALHWCRAWLEQHAQTRPADAAAVARAVAAYRAELGGELEALAGKRRARATGRRRRR